MEQTMTGTQAMPEAPATPVPPMPDLTPAAPIVTQPDAAPEAVASEVPVAPTPVAPVAEDWIEVPREDGTIHTRVRRSEVPNVILEKDAYAYRLKQQNDLLVQQLAARQQQAAPTVDQDTAYIQNATSELVSQGFDESVAAVMAKRELFVMKQQEQRVAKATQQIETQRMRDEYSMIAGRNGWTLHNPDGTPKEGLALDIARAYPNEQPLVHYQMWEARVNQIRAEAGVPPLPPLTQAQVQQMQPAPVVPAAPVQPTQRQVALAAPGTQGTSQNQGRVAASPEAISGFNAWRQNEGKNAPQARAQQVWAGLNARYPYGGNA